MFPLKALLFQKKMNSKFNRQRKTNKIDHIDAQLLIDSEYQPELSLKQICDNNIRLYGTSGSRARKSAQNKYYRILHTKEHDLERYHLLYRKAKALLVDGSENESDQDSDNSIASIASIASIPSTPGKEEEKTTPRKTKRTMSNNFSGSTISSRRSSAMGTNTGTPLKMKGEFKYLSTEDQKL